MESLFGNITDSTAHLPAGIHTVVLDSIELLPEDKEKDYGQRVKLVFKATDNSGIATQTLFSTKPTKRTEIANSSGEERKKLEGKATTAQNIMLTKLLHIIRHALRVEEDWFKQITSLEQLCTIVNKEITKAKLPFMIKFRNELNQSSGKYYAMLPSFPPFCANVGSTTLKYNPITDDDSMRAGVNREIGDGNSSSTTSDLPF